MKGEGQKNRRWCSSMAPGVIIYLGRRKYGGWLMRVSLRSTYPATVNRKGRAANLLPIMLIVWLVL